MRRIHNKFLRILLRCILVLGLGFLTLMGTCRGLGWLMYKQRGCGIFLIDNMELHTRTDIPSHKELDCNYNQQQKLKRVYYIINKKRVAMPRYISFSEFRPLVPGSGFVTGDFFRFHADTLAGRNPQHLFFKEHTKANGAYYKGLLDTNTGQVWLNLQYED